MPVSGEWAWVCGWVKRSSKLDGKKGGTLYYSGTAKYAE